jgi:hypothetical protein
MTPVFDPGTFLLRPRGNPASWPGRDNSGGGVRRYTNVRWSPPIERSQVRKTVGVKRVGLDYERKVLDVLSAIYGDKFVCAPAIRYEYRRKSRLAIPDGILRLSRENIIIVEVKLSHTLEVWEQLVERYATLVRSLERGATVRTVEVCRYYNPDIPVPHTLTQSLHRPGTGLEVMQWKL